MGNYKTLDNPFDAQQAWADENRLLLNAKGIKLFNIIGMPGSGKTSLIERTIEKLKDHITIGVIVGHMASCKDAERLVSQNIPVCLIQSENNGQLAAHQIHWALQELCAEDKLDLIFLENIGTMICPENYDVGEFTKIVILNVTAGQDIAEKYPGIFKQAQVVVLTKVGLLPYVNCDVSVIRKNIKELNSSVHLCEVDNVLGTGFDDWIDIISKIV